MPDHLIFLSNYSLTCSLYRTLESGWIFVFRAWRLLPINQGHLYSEVSYCVCGVTLEQPAPLSPDFPPLDEATLWRKKGLDQALEEQGLALTPSLTIVVIPAVFRQLQSAYLQSEAGLHQWFLNLFKNPQILSFKQNLTQCLSHQTENKEVTLAEED